MWDGAGGSRPWLGVAAFAGLVALAYAAMAGLWLAFPDIHPGADLIQEAKQTRLPGLVRFPSDARNRIIVFGDSRVLAGFRPEIFDTAAGPGVESFNMGLPGGPDFLPLLEDLLRRGVRPTAVLTEQGWAGDPRPPSILQRLQDNSAIADKVLPFRHLLRDVLVCAGLSGGHIVRQYLQNRAEVGLMLAHRGWYFIKGQSHFPHDRLPAGFRLPTDVPTWRGPPLRPKLAGWRYRRLTDLAAHYGFRILIIPAAYRQGSLAPPLQRPPLRQVSGRLLHLGPDYILEPVADFSDPVHLNPTGAQAYSQTLGQAFARRGR